MWPCQKLMHSSVQLLQPPNPIIPTTQIPGTATPFPPIIKQCLKVSRREIAVCSNSSLLLLLGSQVLEPLQLSRARAEDIPQNIETIAPEENLELSRARAEDIPQNIETIAPEENLELSRARAEDIPQNTETVAPEENSKLSKERAEDIPQETETLPKKIDYCEDEAPTQRAFLAVSIDGKPAGRIVIGLYGNKAPFGSARFSKLVSGVAGISYRRKEFVKIMPSYIQHGGVRSYGVDAELARQAGSDLAADRLMDEWEKQNENCPGTKNLARSVGIIVRDPSKPPPKLKLVARKGKLEIDQEEVGVTPNGTEFVIATKDSPELDASTLIVGRVLEGMDVAEKIGQVKTVQANTSSPYFRVAKLIGDKRAVVAERGFNRPYAKVIITNCGLIK